MIRQFAKHYERNLSKTLHLFPIEFPCSKESHSQAFHPSRILDHQGWGEVTNLSEH